MEFSVGGLLVLIAVVMLAFMLIPQTLQNRGIKAQQKQALKLERTLRSLESVAQDTHEDQLVNSAQAALDREKLKRLELQRQRAQFNAELVAAKTEKKLSELQLRRQQRLGKQLLRAERLAGAAYKRLRLVAAVVALLGLVTLVIGLCVIPVLHSLYMALGGLTITLLAVALLAYVAPGRNRILVERIRLEQQVRAQTEQLVSQQQAQLSATKLVDQDGARTVVQSVKEAAEHLVAQPIAIAQPQQGAKEATGMQDVLARTQAGCQQLDDNTAVVRQPEPQAAPRVALITDPFPTDKHDLPVAEVACTQPQQLTQNDSADAEARLIAEVTERIAAVEASVRTPERVINFEQTLRRRRSG